MQAIHAENVNWKSQDKGVREAKIFSAVHGSEETRIDMVEVPAGAYIPAHRHSSRREFITILWSAGAQLQIGDRIFRPIAGQVFHREPGDVLALTNDSQHPFRYSVVRFGYESSDVEILQESSDPDYDQLLEAGSDLDEPEPTLGELDESTEDLEATVEMDALEISAVAESSEESAQAQASKSEASKSAKGSKKAKESKPSQGSKRTKGSKPKE